MLLKFCQCLVSVSLVSVVSKLLERLVARQLLDYLNKSGLLPWLQSAYRVGHSTETAVEGPVGHPARHRLRRLICIGVAGFICGLRHGGSRHSDSAAENVLRSVWNGAAVDLDVSGRPVPVRRTGLSASLLTLIVCGVPQGSVLGPILFLLYTADLILLIRSHGLYPHLYADDTDLRVLPTVCRRS